MKTPLPPAPDMAPAPVTDRQSWKVPESLNGQRLDKAVVALALGLSRNDVKRAIEQGGVRVNGKRSSKGSLVQAGDEVSIESALTAPRDAPPTPSPELPLTVLFETKEVLVLDKPAGQPTAPIRAGETDTLVNAYLARYPELLPGVTTEEGEAPQFFGYSVREPGLVHRLDTDTSGAVLVARTREAFDELRDALKFHLIDKSYWLICKSEGLADEGTIEIPIANHPKDQRRVYPCIHPRDVMRYAPRPASTSYSVLRRQGEWALVEAKVEKALRHQIRAHFSAIGHPLAGDVLYGGEEVPGLARHALHASRIAYRGGAEVDSFDVTSTLPPELAALV